MSRTYQERCPACRECEARSDFIEEGLELIQCLKCGACHAIITKTKLLKTTGTDGKAWDNAYNEAKKYHKEE